MNHVVKANGKFYMVVLGVLGTKMLQEVEVNLTPFVPQQQQQEMDTFFVDQQQNITVEIQPQASSADEFTVNLLPPETMMCKPSTGFTIPDRNTLVTDPENIIPAFTVAPTVIATSVAAGTNVVAHTLTVTTAPSVIPSVSAPSVIVTSSNPATTNVSPPLAMNVMKSLARNIMQVTQVTSATTVTNQPPARNITQVTAATTVTKSPARNVTQVTAATTVMKSPARNIMQVTSPQVTSATTVTN